MDLDLEDYDQYMDLDLEDYDQYMGPECFKCVSYLELRDINLLLFYLILEVFNQGLPFGLGISYGLGFKIGC